jgi:FMN phosphatase YigB (HAD superfamily)
MNRKIIYFDMDNVLVDFASGITQLSEEYGSEYIKSIIFVPIFKPQLLC